MPLACEYCGAVFWTDDEDARCPCQGGPLTPRRIEPANEVRVLNAASVLDELAPGVRGYTVVWGDALYIPLLQADNPGHGDVSRFLDALPRDRTIKFPCVINDILRGALERRGFVEVLEWSDEYAEPVEVFIRKAAPGAPETAPEPGGLTVGLALPAAENDRPDA